MNDDELYQRFLRGDGTAYDELMLRYGDELLLYLKGFMYSWEDAEDIMIEAFARIMASKPRIREGGFKAYLFRTGHNLVSRFYLRDKRRGMFSLDELETEPAAENGIDEDLLKDEKKRLLIKCMGRIPAEMKEALWLVFFEDMSYKDAARVMGKTVKKIDNLLSRGKKLLREELEKEGITGAY